MPESLSMQWKNTSSRYGTLSIVMHWLVAIGVYGLFALGYWMVGLTYYSSWYRTAPDIHKSIGLILLALMVVRVIWRFLNSGPAPLESHGRLTRMATKIGHGVLYLGLFAVMLSGYLISTADGRAISVFGLFNVPAVITSIPGQADIAGLLHEYLAWGVVIFSVLHALAALKHHFIDRDLTLKRMVGRGDA